MPTAGASYPFLPDKKSNPIGPRKMSKFWRHLRENGLRSLSQSFASPLNPSRYRVLNTLAPANFTAGYLR